jgi:hypothetical protein
VDTSERAFARREPTRRRWAVEEKRRIVEQTLAGGPPFGYKSSSSDELVFRVPHPRVREGGDFVVFSFLKLFSRIIPTTLEIPGASCARKERAIQRPRRGRGNTARGDHTG